MKERPILFSAPMVRALLSGTKTQTRRVVRKQFAADATPAEVAATSPEGWQVSGHSGLWWDDCGACLDDAVRCPYGMPGDRLWVRETFAKIDGQTQPWIETDYRATYRHGDRLGDTMGLKKRWTPAIHMPRAASRITLEITEVRVERLQGISEADALAEGIEPIPPTGPNAGPNRYSMHIDGGWINAPTAGEVYRMLWEQIYGEGSWVANPWVWVASFQKIARPS